MMWDNRKWVILTSAEADEMESSDYDAILFASKNELPSNVDNSKYIVKYEGSKPSFLTGKTALTWSQIQTELAEDEWSGEE